MLVVLPAPLTPATMITVGWYSPTTSVFSSGFSRSVMASASRPLTWAGSVARASFTRRRRSSSRKVVAATPASAISSAVSRSSYSASSIFVPVKTLLMPLPVFFRPVRRRLSQPLRAGAAASSAGSDSEEKVASALS